METMSTSVEGLTQIPQFQQILVSFENPLAGVAAGAVFTAIIQSSSAAVGVVQVLAMTGQMTYGAVIPIIMGTCIGTCVTAVISAIGTRREAQQAAVAHLTFNVLGSVIWIIVFMVIRYTVAPAILSLPAALVGIAVINTAFNVLTAAIFLPAAGLLERIVLAVVPSEKEEKKFDKTELDERLLITPPLALKRGEEVAMEMAELSVSALKGSLDTIIDYSDKKAEFIRRTEEETDQIEDALGTFLLRLSSRDISNTDNERITVLLKVIGDYERIADHGVNILESAEEIESKKVTFTDDAKREMDVMFSAVREVIDMTTEAFLNNDIEKARNVEPLEEVIDNLKESLRTRHIMRLKQGKCNADAGFVWSDMLTNLERCSDHCSNIAGSLIDSVTHTRNPHETLRAEKLSSESFNKKYQMYMEKYRV